MTFCLDYSIYILAEGNSSRMGTDKGLVNIADKPMMAHCIDHITPLQKEIVLITSNPTYSTFNCRMISDKIKGRGPVQGILSTLNDASTDKSIIITCDMPLINVSLIERLLLSAKNNEIVCFSKEFIYPFPGIYSKEILSTLTKKVEQGERKLRDLIPQFRHKLLPIEQADLFLNVNTPADVKLVEEKLI